MYRLSRGAPARRALAAAFALHCSVLPAIVGAEDEPSDVIVRGQRQATIEKSPATTASIAGEKIAETVNATNVEDTLKYLPSLVVRKRHIGDTQSPLATRTSGVGASARSLIYADGALLSSLIGNNNTIASPRWGLVSPQEIERIDVMYGPFSAAYPGNAIGAVVNITTRLPDKLEGTVTAGTNIQRFDQYGTQRTLPTYAFGATLGDRFGPLSLFASANRVTSNSQPISYVTATRPAVPGPGGSPVAGGYDDLNRTGAPIRVLGAGGIEHQRQQIFKLKAALDVSSAIRLIYVGGLFLNDTDATAETYLSGPTYAGNLNIAGYPYAVAASAFSNNVYLQNQRQWSHSLSATGTSRRFDWQVIGTLFDYARDEQRIPTGALPAAFTGGAGTITRLDGTGWHTFDAKGLWRSDETSTHSVGFGYHHDRFTLSSNRYATGEWLRGAAGTLNLASRGKTRTDALWLQDSWHFAAPLVLTIGGRQEWWKAYEGANFSLTPSLSVAQPQRAASRFSPKASIAWTPAAPWKLTLSVGSAYRFPTVSELYQAVTSGPVITSPDPTLLPEHALSEELAIQHSGERGYMRLSLFNESITDALLSQSAPVIPGSSTLFNYVQNVDRVRTRGVELAFEQRGLIPHVDLSGSLTLIDPRIRADVAFPAAVGKRPPQLPLRKASLVATWRPVQSISLTAAGRYASRSFATIDNSDVIANTFQGFDGYVVVDLRASFKVTPNWSMALGIDNVGGRKYFLFHPFPQRSFSAEMTWKL